MIATGQNEGEMLQKIYDNKELLEKYDKSGIYKTGYSIMRVLGDISRCKQGDDSLTSRRSGDAAYSILQHIVDATVDTTEYNAFGQMRNHGKNSPTDRAIASEIIEFLQAK